MKKNIKLLIGSITLGLMVAVGVGATASQITKANDNNVGLAQVSEMINFDISEAEGLTPAQWMQKLMDRGLVDKTFGQLNLDYYNAKTEEEKQAADERLIDYLVSTNWMTKEEGDYYKALGHDAEDPNAFGVEF